MSLTAAVLARSKLEWRRRGFGIGERIFWSNLERARLRLMASMSGVDRSCAVERAIVAFALLLLNGYPNSTLTGCLIHKAEKTLRRSRNFGLFHSD